RGLVLVTYSRRLHAPGSFLQAEQPLLNLLGLELLRVESFRWPWPSSSLLDVAGLVGHLKVRGIVRASLASGEDVVDVEFIVHESAEGAPADAAPRVLAINEVREPQLALMRYGDRGVPPFGFGLRCLVLVREGAVATIQLGRDEGFDQARQPIRPRTDGVMFRLECCFGFLKVVPRHASRTSANEDPSDAPLCLIQFLARPADFSVALLVNADEEPEGSVEGFLGLIVGRVGRTGRRFRLLCGPDRPLYTFSSPTQRTSATAPTMPSGPTDTGTGPLMRLNGKLTGIQEDVGEIKNHLDGRSGVRHRSLPKSVVMDGMGVQKG
ncbi:MAG: hypothetical protein OXI12_14340, partial [Gammaproteobacteria bacterium]|nr:hypothetical protein [Gammaproteobacteria bacterium]